MMGLHWRHGWVVAFGPGALLMVGKKSLTPRIIQNAKLMPREGFIVFEVRTKSSRVFGSDFCSISSKYNILVRLFKRRIFRFLSASAKLQAI